MSHTDKEIGGQWKRTLPESDRELLLRKLPSTADEI